MKLKDMALEIAEQMLKGRNRNLLEIQLKSPAGPRSYPVIEMANLARRVLIPVGTAGFILFEERSGAGQGIIPSVVRDMGTHVVRVFDNQTLLLEGVVNGMWVDDVELACTHIAFPTPAQFEQQQSQVMP